MILHSNEYEVRYIDPAILTSGDGLTPKTAYKDFPTTASEYPDHVAFIVRRTSDNVATSLPENLSINSLSLAIIGMPKSTDAIYDIIPQEAKTAWGNDGGDYGYIIHDVNDRNVCGIIADNCKAFDMRYIALMDNNSAYCSEKAIQVRNSTYGCNATIDHCWFRALTDWVGTGEQPSHIYYGGKYLSINAGDRNSYNRFGHRVIFTNNRIDVWSSVTTEAIYMCFTEHIEIRNVEINCVQTDVSNSLIHIGNSGYDEKAPIAFVDNVHAKYYYLNHRGDYFRTVVEFGRCLYCTIQNCSYEKSDTQYWTPYSNRVRFNSFIHVILLSSGSVIKNINIDYSDVRGEYQYGVDIEYNQRYNPEDAQYGQYTKLEDITVTCCSDTPVYNDGHNDRNYENTYNEKGSHEYHLVRARMSNDQDRVVSTDFLIKNLKINAPFGRALYATHSLIDMKTMDIYGSISVTNCMGKIGSVNTWYPGYCVADNGGNLLHINTIECNRFNESFPYTGQHAIIPSYRSNILVTDCNIEMMPNTVNTESQRNCSYICTNNNSHITTGNYFVRNQRSFCRTWSVNRVGSYGGCSLKLSNESGGSDWNYPLLVGGLPFKGVTKTCESAGNYIAKIYATTYGYNDPSMISDMLKVRITKEDKSIVTSYDGNWSRDETSVWENIEAGTAYVLEIPFTVDKAQDIEFEFAFSWDMIGGATYLDPHPVIEKQ